MRLTVSNGISRLVVLIRRAAAGNNTVRHLTNFS
jgi:hypothetical protein